MEIENQVCSLEFAKRLKKLIVEQNSLFYWIQQNNGVPAVLIDKDGLQRLQSNWGQDWKGSHGGYYPAFTVAELGEIMKGKGMGITAYSGLGNDGWWVRGGEWIVEKQQYNHLEVDEKWADVLAKMLIYLIENNLLKSSGRKKKNEQQNEPNESNGI